jgi:hypothetical protein
MHGNAGTPRGINQRHLLSRSFGQSRAAAEAPIQLTSRLPSLSSRRIALSSNDDFLSLVVASVSGQSKSPGVFTCFDLRAAAPPLRHTPLLLSHHHDHNSHTRITLIMVGAPSAAASLVGFLSEPDTALQVFALEELNNDMDNIWTEVSGSIGQMCAPSRETYDKHS